jgi:hypothetical protein
LIPGQPDQKNPSLSEDLTVILLRGNGSPRTFRLSLPALQRSLTALGFLFAFSIVAAISLLVLNLVRTASNIHLPELSAGTTPQPAPVSESLPARPGDAKPETKPFWNLGSNAGSDGKDEGELRKEMQGLREDNAKLAAQADGRKDLPQGQLTGLVQFFGPRNVEEGISPIAVKNVRVSQSPAGQSAKDIYVDFELHNIDPEQRLARGYILVLAKTPGFLAVYPENAYSSSQNILLDYTKGETFGVSRFREARARFSAAQLEGTKPKFQVMLFNGEGKVIANMHVEGQH